MILQYKELGLAFLFLSGTLAFDPPPQNQPRLRSNATLNVSKLSALSTRDLFGLESRDSYYECSFGYSECSQDTSTCCPTGDTCCDSDYCADPGDTCCVIGTCPSGWNCCGNDGYCSPVGGECCQDGYYCNVGYQCKIWDGEVTCCPESGCVGSSGSGDLGTTVTAGTVITGTETATYGYMSTTSDSYTYSYDDYEWDYYYTTYYWSFWFYFWTSYSPYTVQTVTSTETTTTTVWSIYASNSAMASRSFSYSEDVFTLSTPYSATYLQSSTDPVPIETGAAGTPTATGQRPPNGATSVSVNRWVPLLGAVFGCLVGALAFGL